MERVSASLIVEAALALRALVAGDCRVPAIGCAAHACCSWIRPAGRCAEMALARVRLLARPPAPIGKRPAWQRPNLAIGPSVTKPTVL